MPTAPATAPMTLTAVLHHLGVGKDADLARVRLQTMPQDEYLSALPPLWKQQDARYRALWKVFFFALLPGIALFLASGVLLFLGRHEPDNQQHLRFWSSVLMPISGIVLQAPAWTLSALVSRKGRMHKGIILALHLRPHWRLVPQIIETLPFAYRGAEQYEEQKAFRAEHQALLTTLLPLWCAHDTDDLTPKQQKILRDDLKRVAFRGLLLDRSIGEATQPMTEEELDYCIAVLGALRRSPVHTSLPLDSRTRHALEHLPAAHADDPNRRYLQEAAREVLAGRQ